MPYVVYILYSVKDRKLYVGQTADLHKRLRLHFSGKVRATQHRRPLKLLRQEQYETRGEAMKREKFLKSLWSARFKKKLLEKTTQKDTG